jgi:energy-coupling factor transport system substrate-specific component
MNKSKISIRDIAHIAMGIAALICGGFVILQISLVFPLPGIKYIFMAPFISMVIYILIQKLESTYGFMWSGLVFAVVMIVFSIFMTIAIAITSILTQLSVLLIRNVKWRNIVGSILFSTFMGLSALFVSKFMIGGVYAELSNIWILVTGIICTAFGNVGVFFGIKLSKNLKLNISKKKS